MSAVVKRRREEEKGISKGLAARPFYTSLGSSNVPKAAAAAAEALAIPTEVKTRLC